MTCMLLHNFHTPNYPEAHFQPCSVLITSTLDHDDVATVTQQPNSDLWSVLDRKWICTNPKIKVGKWFHMSGFERHWLTFVAPSPPLSAPTAPSPSPAPTHSTPDEILRVHQHKHCPPSLDEMIRQAYWGDCLIWITSKRLVCDQMRWLRHLLSCCTLENFQVLSVSLETWLTCMTWICVSDLHDIHTCMHTHAAHDDDMILKLDSPFLGRNLKLILHYGKSTGFNPDSPLRPIWAGQATRGLCAMWCVLHCVVHPDVPWFDEDRYCESRCMTYARIMSTDKDWRVQCAMWKRWLVVQQLLQRVHWFTPYTDLDVSGRTVGWVESNG